MRIGLERDVCAGHGSCAMVDEDLFPIDDDGFSILGPDVVVPEGQEVRARQGVDACPMRALKILG